MQPDFKFTVFTPMKKIIIAGGSGFLGSYITKRFRSLGYKVTIVSRSGDVGWSSVDLRNALDGADVLINLAGRSINCRHNPANKHEILFSRVNSTMALAEAMKHCGQPPHLWINASAVGIYPLSEHSPMTEDVTRSSNSFIAEVVSSWENAFFTSVIPGLRKVALRTSVVLGGNGGAFPVLKKLVSWGLGGIQGSGRQMFSWIHVEDYFRVLMFIMDNDKLEGPVNCTAPNPVSNNKLMYVLRKSMKRSLGLPAPAFLVRLGSLLIGTEASLALDSVNVAPGKLMKSHFQFKYPSIDLAVLDLIHIHD